jgi:hypothetical protein
MFASSDFKNVDISLIISEARDLHKKLSSMEDLRVDIFMVSGCDHR